MSATQFVKFCIVGGTGTAMNLAVMWLLVEISGMHYLPASIVSFAVALTSNFVLNKLWTFRGHRRRSIVSQYAKYWAVSVTALAVNLAVLWALVELAGIWYLAAQLAGIIIATGLNYVGSKRWSFG